MKCIVLECEAEAVQIPMGVHCADLLCQVHFDNAEGWFERQSGSHIFEYRDVEWWVKQGMPYKPPRCWKDTGSKYSCELARDHEGTCVPWGPIPESEEENV